MKAVPWLLMALAAILIALLVWASGNTRLSTEQYPVLLGLNAAVAVAMAALSIWQLRALLLELRAGVFGSRLKLKLLAAFAALGVAPGIVIYALSVQFVGRSIDSWFDVRVEAALEGGLSLGRSVLDYLSRDLSGAARAMAFELGELPPLRRANELDRLRAQAGATEAFLFAINGSVIAVSGQGAPHTVAPTLPAVSQLRQAWQGKSITHTEGEGGAGLVISTIVPVVGRELAAQPMLLQLKKTLPDSLAASAESVQAVYRDYQELSLARVGLKRIFGLTLTLALLLALLSAIAVAFTLSRRLSAPLSILAEGTRAVTEGDFSQRREIGTRDELGVLTQSFNRMTAQLEDARAQADASRAETEAARAYLESVLTNISAGVLAFNAEGRLRAANKGAMDILRDPLQGCETQALGEWTQHPELRDALLAAFSSGGDYWQGQIDLTERPADGGAEARPGHMTSLLLRVTRLAGAAESGYVVVFDDITELLAAQRAAAWTEVARRLAHEIKNPLTPIQLSAERLQHKLAERLDADDRTMLTRSIGTIVAQVEALKHMVNDFRNYATLPAPQRAPLDLNHLINEVLRLYEGSPVRVMADLCDNLPPVSGDANQLRQVIHNLLQNAEDAVAAVGNAEIEVRTRLVEDRAEVTVRDNGAGFEPRILARAFEPYVTTKSRGTGLGLAIVKKIVDEHDGDIRLANVMPAGAEIRIVLPLAA